VAGSDREREFTAFVAARRPYLRHTAYLLCGDWHRAEDVVQIALAKLYVAWPRVRRKGAEEAYARRIIARTNIDESRRAWRRERVGLEQGDDREAASGPSVEDRDELMAALRTLPQGQRKAVLLRYWCGLSVAETAADLGCSEGSVKRQTSRAMDKLRRLLSTSEASITTPGEPT
jgi:RNA polymerase sigma-70 factor (sigma-E family)